VKASRSIRCTDGVYAGIDAQNVIFCNWNWKSYRKSL